MRGPGCNGGAPLPGGGRPGNAAIRLLDAAGESVSRLSDRDVANLRTYGSELSCELRADDRDVHRSRDKSSESTIYRLFGSSEFVYLLRRSNDA
jgi:hypothetical protein